MKSQSKPVTGFWGFLLTGMAIFLLGGCAGRQHMSPEYGQSSESVLAAQRVYPESSSAQPNGLDSEEASIVHDAYRRSIGKTSGGQPEEKAKVLLIDDSGKK